MVQIIDTCSFGCNDKNNNKLILKFLPYFFVFEKIFDHKVWNLCVRAFNKKDYADTFGKQTFFANTFGAQGEFFITKSVENLMTLSLSEISIVCDFLHFFFLTINNCHFWPYLTYSTVLPVPYYSKSFPEK